LFDVDRISVICHKNNALAVFDYAAVAPYVEININGVTAEIRSKFAYALNESDHKLCYKDAVFISPHKFVGGPASSGILVAKKNLLFDKRPDRIGGGPIFFVNE
jgi:selenocysteine lyase/cysteine desulfurase